MSATERLRKMLDERGVAYLPVTKTFTGTDPMNDTFYRAADGIGVTVSEFMGKMHITTEDLTPKQVIEVTLDRGTCHIVDEWGDGWWECDKCGCTITGDDPHDHPCCNYCPNCGARVIEDVQPQP